jgi:DNA-binding SARP family transcriptional activator/tetratricopeptide (TPR) repeat protein
MRDPPVEEATAPVELRLLGPLEVTGPDGPVRIGGSKERLVLALLVLRAGEVVSRDALVDSLWSDDPPVTAVKTLQGHVARVRRALEAAGLAGTLRTRDPGYVLDVPAASVDVAAFERHVGTGHGALLDGDPARAALELGQALALWRGDALADCRSEGWAAAEAARLDGLRLATVEDRIDADLALGHHSVLVSELESLVVRHPLRERLWAALMLALYRSGRQGEAMRAYQHARDVLVEELGLEPGAELRRLEAAVLAGDPILDAPDPTGVGTVGPGPDLPIPFPARVAAAASSVFVGRADERERLNTAFRAVTPGHRRVVVISGEPGIGKTSLSAAAARTWFDDGAVVLYGRCDEDLGIPYQAWAELLAHLVRHAPEELLAEHVAARGSVLTRLAPELARRTAVAHVPSSDAASERYLLFGAVVDLFARVSAVVPLVLVLDDLHWADRPTIQLLRHLVSGDAPLPSLVIGTFRTSDVTSDHPLGEALASLHRESGVERLVLRGLGAEDLLTMLEEAAGAEFGDNGHALRDALLAETDGNPFFVGELLRHLTETGAVHQDDSGRWVASAALRASGLPVSVREVIGQRVAHLGEPARGVLSLAAVIGRDFDAEVLGRVAEADEDTLIDLCDQAVTAGVLTEAAVAGRYTFSHALIEHTLYDGLSAGRRGRAHRAVAEALEKLCGDDPEDAVGQLAHHWAHAQPPDRAKALRYAQRAGDRALAQLAPDEALRWYRDALGLLEHGPVDDARRRATLLLGFGDAQRQTGDPAHRETLLAAGRLADDVGALDVLVGAALRNNRGWNSIIGAVDHDRVEMNERALARLGDADTPDRARLLALLCAEHNWDLGFDERFSMAKEAVGIARRSGDEGALVDAIRLCHESVATPQSLELRRVWNTEACSLADHLGDPNARLHANDFRSLAALEAGDVATMREACAIFDAESERIGQPLNRWQVAYHRSWQRMLDGDLDAAEQWANDALALGSAAGIPEDAAMVFGGQLFTVRSMQGRMDEVLPLAEQLARDAPRLPVFQATIGLALSYGEAREQLRQLLDTQVEQDFPVYADVLWLATHTCWAGAITRSGHRPGARVLYERLLPWQNQFATTHTTLNGGISHFLGLLAQTLGRQDEADDWFAKALALHEAMHAPHFVAATQAAWAGLLADRDRPGDRARAQALVAAALPVTVERGYGYVERDAREVLARIRSA